MHYMTSIGPIKNIYMIKHQRNRQDKMNKKLNKNNKSNTKHGSQQSYFLSQSKIKNTFKK